MRSKDGRRGKERALVREALERAPGSTEPDVAAIVSAVPDLMAEARRRREAVAPDLVSVVASGAWRAIPRLAAAAAAAVALAALASFVERTPANGAATSLESVILSGGEGEGTTDLLLEAVLAAEKNHG